MTAALVDRTYWMPECDVQSSSKVWIKWYISFYRSYGCLINIFNSFLKRGVSLRVFIFMPFLTHSFQIKNVILFTRFLIIMWNYLSRKKKIGGKMLFLWNTISAVECKRILFYK